MARRKEKVIVPSQVAPRLVAVTHRDLETVAFALGILKGLGEDHGQMFLLRNRIRSALEANTESERPQ